MREVLAKYVRQPSLILDRLKGKVEPKLSPKFFDQPVFTRNLGHQLAQTYSEEEEAGINALIHSAYARALTNTHGAAAGRYNEYLRPLLPGAAPNETRKMKGSRIAEVSYDMPLTLKLPALSVGLCREIQSVRSTDEYRKLRQSLRVAGQEQTFQQQRDAWSGFADVLNQHISKGRDVSMQTVVVHGIETGADHLTSAAAFHLFACVVVSASGGVALLNPSMALEALGPAAVAVATAVGIPLLRSWAEEDDTRAELQRAVTFVAKI